MRFYFDNLTNKVSKPNIPTGIEHSFIPLPSDIQEMTVISETNGVETQIQHPILMSDQPAYSASRKETSNASKVVNQFKSTHS